MADGDPGGEVTSEHDKARDAAIQKAGEAGWTAVRVTKSGYTIMRCSCGAHQETLKKTPSNPKLFSQKGHRMVSVFNASE